MPEPEPDHEPDPEPAFEPADSFPEPVDTLTDEELEAVFGSDSEPGPIGTFIDSGFSDDSTDSLAELEAMEDPEPIPEVFSASDIGTDEDDMEEEASGSGLLKVVVAVLVVLFVLGGLAAGLIVGRPYVEQYVPGADKIYEKVVGMVPHISVADLTKMVGLGGGDSDESAGAGSGSVPGKDLAIENLQTDVQGGEDAQILTVRGEIKNVTDKPQMVPLIKISVLSGKGEVLQSTVVEPIESRLPPKMSITFEGKVENFSALARDMRVEFTDAMKK